MSNLSKLTEVVKILVAQELSKAPENSAKFDVLNKAQTQLSEIEESEKEINTKKEEE